MSKKKSRAFSFSTTPTIKMSRTKMPLSYNRTMSASLGTLYPMYFEEVLPGDTFKVKSKIISRLTSSFLKPAFANIFLDTYYFFIPSRLVYDDFSCVFGENKDGYWAQERTYEIPSTNLISGKNLVGTVADYLELPIMEIGSNLPKISLLPFRCNALVYNEWFRDENFIAPVNINTGDVSSNFDETLNDREWSVTNYTGKLPKVSKYHDYFTSVLPAPQKGAAVDLASFGAGFFPLTTNGDTMSSFPNAMRFASQDNRPFSTGDWYMPLYIGGSGTGRGNQVVSSGNLSNTVNGGNVANDQYQFLLNGPAVQSSNLGIRIQDDFSISVNDLRLAFQTQKMLEKDAMYGTRYVEYLLGHFGVSSPDARMQRPEFLGGRRLNIGISQVAQTSASTEDNALGDLAGYSLSDGSCGFSKGFTEHGYIIGYCCYRQFHTYQQGLDRRFTRFNRLDYYDPVFANIGNQPVMSTQIYAGADSEDVFGYQEAWADYRFHANNVTGQMRSVADNSLDIWHLADEYNNAPVAGKQFITETPNFLDRAISVTSSVQDQFILDIWHDVEAVRVMPLRSIPGLIDHH